VVLQDNWVLYADSNFERQYPPILGPGLYPFLPAGIKNDDLSSLQPVMDRPTSLGQHFDSKGHIILFEHANFRGRHKHVFTIENSLNASDDNFFNDRVSSFGIIAGDWRFFKNSNALNPYPVVVGPPNSMGEDGVPGPFWPGPVGGVSFVEHVGIKNDDMSSLRPVSMDPRIPSSSLAGHVLLFEHAHFRGAHKHVFAGEPNLNAPEDKFFNDRVSSIAVLFGAWQFCIGSNYEGIYPPVLRQGPDLTPGLTPSVQTVGIKNDDMSSLFPVG
jgi:hypothetical protein